MVTAPRHSAAAQTRDQYSIVSNTLKKAPAARNEQPRRAKGMEMGKNSSGKGQFTMLGEGTVFEGTMSIPHDVRIEGSIKGKIETAESLTVGPTGVVEADIKAKSAIIGGKVVGNVIVDDRVELESNATLIGDLTTRDLIINEGSVFHGNCSMESIKGERV
jgi:cytoskeletal protein CcmA (bactofilin family)